MHKFSSSFCILLMRFCIEIIFDCISKEIWLIVFIKRSSNVSTTQLCWVEIDHPFIHTFIFVLSIFVIIIVCNAEFNQLDAQLTNRFGSRE